MTFTVFTTNRMLSRRSAAIIRIIQNQSSRFYFSEVSKSQKGSWYPYCSMWLKPYRQDKTTWKEIKHYHTHSISVMCFLSLFVLCQGINIYWYYVNKDQFTFWISKRIQTFCNCLNCWQQSEPMCPVMLNLTCVKVWVLLWISAGNMRVEPNCRGEMTNHPWRIILSLLVKHSSWIIIYNRKIKHRKRDSPVPSCVSMESDWSKGPHVDLKDGHHPVDPK